MRQSEGGRGKGEGYLVFSSCPKSSILLRSLTFYSDSKTVAPVPFKKILKRANYLLLEFIHAMTHLITKVTQTVATSTGT